MPKVGDGDGVFSNTSTTTVHNHVTDALTSMLYYQVSAGLCPAHMAYGLMPCMGQEVWWVQPKHSASDHD